MLTWLAIIVAYVLVIRARNRIDALEGEAHELREALSRLRRPVEEWKPVPKTTVAPPAPAPRPAPETVAARSTIEPSVAMQRPTVAQAPPPPAAPPPPPRPAAAPRPPVPAFDWEKLIGVRLFSWIAGAALALGAVFFLRYSVQQGWLRPEIRMVLGLITGLGLLVGCELKAARRYEYTANALDASGIAILFATVYASFALWQLVPSAVAFGLLVLVTGIAVLLSIRRGSMFIAVLGLLGGFATPALLASGQDNPIGLFGYLLLLNGGLAWVAYRKRWAALTALSMVFTTLYQWIWVGKFLTADKLPLAASIFLVFPVLSLVAFALGRAPAADAKDDGLLGARALFTNTTRASAGLPLLFSLYLAAVPAYGAHFGILFGFLFVLAAGLFAISITQGPASLHFLGALSTVVAFAIWFSGSYSAEAWPWVLAFVVAFVALFLVAPIIASRVRGPSGGGMADRLGSVAVFAAPLLLFAFPVLLTIEPRAAAPGLTFGVLFVLAAGCAVYAIARGEGTVHFVAAFFTVAGEAVWSARYLDASRLYPALALYGVFGLFYVGIPTLARRFKRPLEPAGAAGIVTLVSLALLLFVAGGSVAPSALWGMALLIAVLNVGLLGEASHTRTPLLSLVGALLSWIVLGVWWFTVALPVMILPALVVMAGFAMLTLAGNAWARDGDHEGSVTSFDNGMFVGLVGHVFIAFVVTRPELSIPPWPVFGVLGALQVAVLGAALFTRRGALHLAAAMATGIILILWTSTVSAAPWPQTAVFAAAISVVLAFVALPLARRVGAPSYEFGLAAGFAALLAQVVAIFGQMRPGAPPLPLLGVAQVAFIAATMALAWIDVEHLGGMAVAAVAPALMAGALWETRHDHAPEWAAQLGFTTPMYLAFIAHPLLLGRRARGARGPFVAAVLASAGFFFLARHALLLGGFANVIGALPVVQALLLAPVLARLVRLERELLTAAPSTDRPASIATDRLVLVAGAVLALVTTAIPLQLEKNWITIAWALEGAALLWLFRRLTHAGLLIVAAGLLATVFVRLTLNPAVLSYHPRGALPILNWYLYTYLVCAAAMFAAARFAHGAEVSTPLGGKLTGAFSAAGAVLLFLLVNIEIADFYSTGATITFNFNASLAQDLTYTLGWAAFAVAVLAVGIAAHNRTTRVSSIILLVMTVLKCFVHDLGRLGGLYRVGSFVGLALCLAFVALALQKFVLAPGEAQPAEAQP